MHDQPVTRAGIGIACSRDPAHQTNRQLTRSVTANCLIQAARFLQSDRCKGLSPRRILPLLVLADPVDSQRQHRHGGSAMPLLMVLTPDAVSTSLQVLGIAGALLAVLVLTART